ncbi:SGNH/GDSL hydrolase family protein [Metabacillus crassostreae]|uniref:SGNH/GDSL hydrolase family protein n=1 Tax=Metabacillus crassostreae TaxID=929098 RepID=UPI001EF80878|nr:SGNH/GDSL hydrolase family protein [Metabacillus crassostreae]
MIKKLVTLSLLLLLIGMTITPATSANEVDEKLTIVSLGDSITMGWGIDNQDPNTITQSPSAFPFLIGNSHNEVLNVSYPGWTSLDLLNAVSHGNAKEKLQQADVVTLNIGANDLLQAINLQELIKSGKSLSDPAVVTEIKANVAAATGQITNSLSLIINVIKQETDAPILLYSLYNPFGPDTTDPQSISSQLHLVGNSITESVNTYVYNPMANNTGSHYLDSYSAYDGKQAEYIIPGDIHPNKVGQQILADLATAKLLDLFPSVNIVASYPSEEQTSDSVQITIEEIEHLIHLKWLPGEKSVDSFLEEGNLITGNTFEVTKNGTYSIYAKTALSEAVITLEVKNIVPKVEEPVEEEPDEEEPPVTKPVEKPKAEVAPPKNEGTKPIQPKETVKVKIKKPKQTVVKSGHALPNTATNMYSFLVAGMCLVGVGGGVFITQRKRKIKSSKIE